MKLACGYARRSTDDQDGSLPAQWAQLAEYAARNGYQIVERFEDDGISGTSLNRPGLSKLIEAAHNGAGWQFVLVWDRSRLGRPEDPREAIAVTYDIERQGKTIIPIHGTKQTGNPMVDTILEALEFGQAGEESIRKSRDVLRGQRESARRGSVPNGKPPYGYDALYRRDGKPVRRVRFLSDGSKHVLTPDGKRVTETFGRGHRVGRSDGETFVLVPGDSEEAGVVQEIFRDFLDGHSPRSIALGLNRRGVISPRGKTWGRSTIIRVLRNPSYKGTLAWNRQTCARFHAASPDGQIARISNPAGRYKENPESKWVAVDGVWDGLVPAAEWKEANARLKGTRASACRGKGAASAFLASGLLRCTCGFHFAGCSFNDKDRPGQRYEYYRCLGNSERRMVTCTAKRIRRPVVDDYLERRIRELYFEPAAKKAVWKDVQEQLDAVLAAASAKDPCRKDRERLEEVGRRIGRLVEAVAGGALVLEDVKQQMASLKAEQAEIQARLARNKAAPRTGDIRSLRDKVLVACREQLERESDLWPDATPEQRKQIVRAHVAGMTADYAKSRITTEFYPLVTAGEIGIQATTC